MRTISGAGCPPQFDVTTHVNGVELDREQLDDPFIMHTVTIGQETLRDALSSDEGTLTVTIRINGTRAAFAHVFRPIDLSPNDEHPEPFEGAATASTEE